MSKRNLCNVFAAAILALACFGTSSTYGQQTTEQFIPIGKSPGVSDTYSFIGTIVAVDTSTHTIVVDSNRGEREVNVTEATRIWLDRSATKQTNTLGAYEDCEIGRKVEVMHEHDDETVADWIKIESQ